MADDSTVPVLGYWKIRGLAQPIRFLLHYVGEEFEDKRYEWGPNTTQEVLQQYWRKERLSLGLDFPNVPYYIDENVKLSQSFAILRYLGTKYSLEAKTSSDKTRLNLLAEECSDLKARMVSLIYDLRFDELRAEFVQKLRPKLIEFERFLGDQTWFLGQQITWIDFALYEFLYQHRLMCPECFEDCSALNAFIQRFENLPAIKQYMASEAYLHRPLYGPNARFVAD